MNSGTALGLLGMYSACASVGVIATVALRTGLSAPTGPAKTIASCVPVTFVTAACVALFYAFAFNQSSTAWSEHARLKSEAKKAGEKPPKFNERLLLQVRPLAGWPISLSNTRAHAL